MIITVNKEEFSRAVAITRRALSKIIIQQERGHLLVTVADGKMRVTGTNNDLKAHYILDAECAARASFTCDPSILSKVLSKIDMPEVTLDYTEEDQSVKVFTNETGSSMANLQSFPASMMLTFEPNSTRSVVVVPRETLLTALSYSLKYLSAPKEDSRNFDIVSISKGILYAANGNNMMGFMVAASFKPLEGIWLRKAVIPILFTTLSNLKDDDVGVMQTQSDVGIETESVYFSSLKPAMEPPSVQTQHIKSEGPYTLVERSLLLKHLERLVVSHTGPKDVIGVEMTLGGAGDSSYIDLSLLSSKSIERVPAVRVDDDSAEEVKHTVDYKILKSVLSSVEHTERVRLHINEPEAKRFKVYDKGAVGPDTFIQVGLGGFARITKA